MKEVDVKEVENLFLVNENEWVNVLPFEGGKEEPHYKIYGVGEFLGLECEEQIMYLDPLVRSESIVMITGSGGVGKTMFILGLCKSLVSGEKFGDWEVKNPTKVLYIDGELPTSVFKDRVKKFGISDGFYIMSSSVDRDKPFSLSDEDYTTYVKKYLIDNDIKVCVFDNLSSLTSGLDENSKREYDPINRYFLDLRRFGITSIIVHHTGKNKREQRGTSGRTDQIDIWINLVKQSTEGNNLKVQVVYEKWRHEPLDESKYKYFTMNGDTYSWSCSSSNRGSEISENERMILTLINEGKSQIFISGEIGTTQPYVSKIVRKYKEKGVLDENNKLTDEGKVLLELE